MTALALQWIDDLRAAAIEEHINVSELPVVPMHARGLELHRAPDRRVAELFRFEIAPHTVSSGDRIVLVADDGLESGLPRHPQLQAELPGQCAQRRQIAAGVEVVRSSLVTVVGKGNG